MKPIVWILAVAAVVVVAGAFVYFRAFAGVQEAGKTGTGRSFYDLKTHTLEGEPADLSQYRGKVALVVNTASKCGLTPQYEGLEALYRELEPRGFVILGFPSNDFMGQEPGTPQEIRSFCTTKFDISFPLFEKVKVKGDGKGEVYRFLAAGGLKEPDWNFTKYLIDPEGNVVARFGPRTKPDDEGMRERIEGLLAGGQ